MNDYGKSIGGGSVLGAATVLPATGIVASGTANEIVVFGVFFAVLISFSINLTMIMRFLLNIGRK
jgi:hypothetical protein